MYVINYEYLCITKHLHFYIHNVDTSKTRVCIKLRKTPCKFVDELEVTEIKQPSRKKSSEDKWLS